MPTATTPWDPFNAPADQGTLVMECLAQMTTSVEIRPTIAVLMAHATTQCTCAAGYTGDGFFCAVSAGPKSLKGANSGAPTHLPCLGTQAALVMLLGVVLPCAHTLV
ncbi:uncharacterized protein LOC135820624 [Sycon ciliatum]|uniref:uncharacterized protein LOC135820624 n=1 Tax=Sycon ciliatum TaxID=27933 RepID=UPI0031F6F811|eukprot:scpid92248/ scgid3163/ 